jgi:phage protein U
MLSITLDADQGVNPRSTFDSLIKAAEKGTVEYLVVGGKLLGRYYIESMGDTWERFFQGGGLTRATGEITFAEYA